MSFLSYSRVGRKMADVRNQILKIANAYGTKLKADVLIYNGPIERGIDYQIIELTRKRHKRQNLIFILITAGGDAHAGYRIGRCLQDKYQHVTICVPGWCKNAGTLLAIAGSHLSIGDHGELGPIDVQRLKPDEVWQSSSGLTEESAISSLVRAAWKMFESFLAEVKDMSGGQIGFKAAADAISPIVSGAFAPVFSQIDPLKIGENARAINIASDYGHRLNIKGRNLSSAYSMEMLVSGYPDHGFVIDIEEAKQLFSSVSSLDNEVNNICSLIGNVSHVSIEDSQQSILEYLNNESRKSRKKRTTIKTKQGKSSNVTRGSQSSGETPVTATNDGRTASGTVEAAQTGSGPNVSPFRR